MSASPELLDVAFDVVRRFRDFHEYGSKQNVLKALRRRCKGFEASDYEAAFDKAEHLFEMAREVVAENIATIYEFDEELTVYFERVDEEMKQRCPGFASSTIQSALGWILFWHHLK